MIERIDQILRWRAETDGQRTAFTFLRDGVHPERSVTYADLDRRARAIAAGLRQECAVGDRVVLAFGEGIEFVEALFGCFYAGLIAVPAPPLDAVRLKRSAARLRAIVANARPTLLLTNDARDVFVEAVAPTPCPAWGSFDDALADTWQPPRIGMNDLAYLQYTSGSTTSPKGVMVTHDNAISNLRGCVECTAPTPDAVSLSWMPNFHDFGLMYGVLFPVYTGMPAYLATTRSFLKRPASWLEAISRYGVTHTGGATFAYDYCVQRVTLSALEGCDLSSVQQLAIGAEPILPYTIRSFNATFAPLGLNPSALFPAYGQAEIAALATALKPPGQVVTILDLPTQSGRELVSCGLPTTETTVAIVDPDRLTPCADGETGEIWLAGPSVAVGYWGDQDATETTFGARIAGSDAGPFLRTGDLGFLHQGELYVAGRRKHMLIVHGQNYYAEEIERIVKESHALLQTQATAVFGVEHGGGEAVVVVQELDRTATVMRVQDAIAAMRRAVADDIGLSIHTIVFVKRGSVPRTTSGKVQRSECRAQFLDDTLVVLHRWTRDEAHPVADLPTGDDLSSQLAHIWQDVLGFVVKPTDSFFEVGATSLDAVHLVTEVEQRIGKRVPDAFFADPTIEHLARLLRDDSPTASTPVAEVTHRQRGASWRDWFASNLPRKLRAAPRTRWPRLLIEHAMVCLPYPVGRRMIVAWTANPLIQRWFFRDECRIVHEYLQIVRPTGTVVPDHLRLMRPTDIDNSAIMRRALTSMVMDDHCRPARNARGSDDPASLTALRGLFWKPFRQAASAQHSSVFSLRNDDLLSHIPADRGCIIVTYHAPSMRFITHAVAAGLKRPVLIFRRQGLNTLSRVGGDNNGAMDTQVRDRALLLHHAQEHVQRGGIVVIAAEGDMGTSQRIPTTVFGRHLMLRSGFAELALRTAAAVIPARLTMRDDGRWECVLGEPSTWAMRTYHSRSASRRWYSSMPRSSNTHFWKMRQACVSNPCSSCSTVSMHTNTKRVKR